MRNIAEILNNPAYKRRIMVTVFPHPDDESMPVGGVVREAVRRGWRVIAVSLTRGEAGMNFLSGDSRALSQIRTEEMHRACGRLGVGEVIAGEFEDGNLRRSRMWQKWMRDQISRLQPDIILTYDPSGFYGHPDHIAVTREVVDMFQNGGAFDLLFVSVPGYVRKLARGKLGKWVAKAGPVMVEPTHRLRLGWGWWQKWQAVAEHKSQKLGKDLPVPLGVFLLLFNYELYHLADRKRRYATRYFDYPIEKSGS